MRIWDWATLKLELVTQVFFRGIEAASESIPYCITYRIHFPGIGCTSLRISDSHRCRFARISCLRRETWGTRILRLK